MSSRLEKRSELTAEMLERIERGEVGKTIASLSFTFAVHALKVGEHSYADSKRALMLWTPDFSGVSGACHKSVQSTSAPGRRPERRVWLSRVACIATVQHLGW